ncbi:MAG: winged helix-turn-helix transcriptional regulator [Candidatus Thorarchaeota archaeon]
METEEYKSIIYKKRIPPSAKIVLNLLRKNSPLSANAILKESKLAPRTVRYALKKLLEANIIQKLYNLDDMRKYLYVPYPLKNV